MLPLYEALRDFSYAWRERWGELKQRYAEALSDLGRPLEDGLLAAAAPERLAACRQAIDAFGDAFNSAVRAAGDVEPPPLDAPTGTEG